MENSQKIVNALIDKKAKENNTIDLNAYAIGALDALEKSKYTEMLEILNEIILLEKKYFSDNLLIKNLSKRVEKLIKEATEL